MAFTRAIRVGGHVYYALVENYREDGKTKQRILKYRGRFPIGDFHPLPPDHARQLLSDLLTKSLSPASIRSFLDTIGIQIGKYTVKVLGIEFTVRRKRWALRLR